MLTKSKFVIVVILILTGIQNGFSKMPPYVALKILSADINVGTKINDSTGQVTISNLEIQQNIIPGDSLLSGLILTNDQPVLQVNSIATYLIFKATNIQGEHIRVAVEVLQSNSTFIYQQGGGKEIHLCKSYGNCTGCQFIQALHRIITCNCDGVMNSMSSTTTGCHHMTKKFRL